MEIKLFHFIIHPYRVCTQEVISALRGTGQEVTLLLCRPEHGILPEMDTSTLVSQKKKKIIILYLTTVSFQAT